MKIGIVVPFSWSYWGGVVEHAENQARALIELGHEARIIIGNDPPGRLTRTLHPREGRHGALPDFVIPVGRTVIIPANGSLSNICLTPRAMRRMKRVFAQERFDVLHVHEPLAPILSPYSLAAKPCPVVVTAHSSGGRWYAWGRRLWHVLVPRIDYRIAVSEQARQASEPNIGGPFEIVPNGVLLPPAVHARDRAQNVVFVGRHEQRKGLPVLLAAWPEVHRRTGARLRLMGADPLAVRLLLRRLASSADGIDILGVVSAQTRTDELLRAKLLTAPATGAESFGLVLAEAFATATPVVASDIAGYREVADRGGAILVPPGDVTALADGLVGLLDDEPRRRALGEEGRRIAEARFSWSIIAARLVEIYQSLLVDMPARAEAAVA